MCGRYASTRDAADLAAFYDADSETGDEAIEPNYNVAPTDPVHVVRMSGERRLVSRARWGLLPPWESDLRAGARMINARAETAATSRAYRRPFARRRCLVPADGWYEWQRPDDGGPVQPYYLTPRHGGVLTFAGLWEIRSAPGSGDAGSSPRPGAASPGGRMITCTILTTAALGDLRMVHDRMPLALGEDRWAAWLGADGAPAPAAEAAELLRPPGLEWVSEIELRPVGKAVGDVRNNSTALIQPVTSSIPGVERAEPVDLTLF
ncbi:MAG: SOS response-associated peptidase [Micromonosporaceae bacterium]|nr:SOS response-associated peptidase [Micromonosporaceae bacterium]